MSKKCYPWPQVLSSGLRKANRIPCRMWLVWFGVSLVLFGVFVLGLSLCMCVHVCVLLGCLGFFSWKGVTGSCSVWDQQQPLDFHTQNTGLTWYSLLWIWREIIRCIDVISYTCPYSLFSFFHVHFAKLPGKFSAPMLYSQMHAVPPVFLPSCTAFCHYLWVFLPCLLLPLSCNYGNRFFPFA